MSQISKPQERVIIEDFAKEILGKRMKTAKPAKEVIRFRTDIQDGIERDVWRVPIEILRYRKDNGRIASDVKDYESNTGILDERDEQAQAQIADFLEQKDSEKTAILRKSIMHDGQLEPAIITCDGFLINGNRRKMVMERLRREYPENSNYTYMKAVILPGKEDEGGPPTLYEIEKLENRYQLQSEGKSEYYGFDRALSIKRKVELGLSLEEQLKDDPRYAEASHAELEKAVKNCKKNFLEPLECVDKYLKQFKREGQYRTISTGMSDPEGRWQAFIDYSNTYKKCFKNAKKRIKLGIEEDEIGEIEEAAFDIIRLRAIPDMSKVHTIMRDLAKYCETKDGNKDGKKEILKIAEKVEPVLSSEESKDQHGDPLQPKEIDAKWAAKNKQDIIYHTKRARDSYESKKEKETPLGLLEAALKKLNHDDMDLSSINLTDLRHARKVIIEIKDRADELEGELYHFEKEAKKLANKKT